MKKYTYFCVLALFFMCFFNTIQAQVTDDTDTEDLIQTTAEGTDAEIDFTSELENLAAYQKNKINLNKATYEDLLNIVFLDEIKIQSLLKYRETLGDFISIYELQAIPTWQLADIYKILPYVTINENPYTLPITLKNLATQGTHELVARTRFVVQNASGYVPNDLLTSQYLGNKYAHFTRYRYRFDNRISAGFTAEKDAGEQFFKGTQPQGFDYYSGHLEINNVGEHVKKLVIGDFQAQFGQGLNMWSGLAFGKSPMVMTTKRQAQGIRSYRSANEAAFFRGVAATIKLGKIELSTFYSNHKLDSRIDTTLGDNLFEGSISSFLVGGMHRTPSELAAKNQVSQQIIGANAKYSRKLSSIGITATYTQFAYPFVASEKPYKFFDFTGENLANISIDYKQSIKNLTLFGETAKSITGGWATLNGALLVLDNNLAISILHRNYARNYQSFWANAFGESTRPKNEKGLYIGATYTPAPKINISAYTDSYRYDWLRYQADAPSAGTDYFAEVRYKYSRKAQYYARYRYRSVPENKSSAYSPILPQIDNNTKHQFRINASYKLQNLSLQTRIENTFVTDQNKVQSKGYVVFQDVNYKALNVPITFNVRYALFSCPSYDSRIYAYENDVMYFYSIPAYYGTGSRIYALTRIVVGNHLDFWVRYAHTWYTDRTVIGSGLEKIQGNLKSEIKLQMRLRF
jgi:hypothetical protein